jgi:hypothetical protein
LSVAVPLTDWPAPLAVNVVAVGQLFTPESASEQLKAAVTSVLFHPLAFAAGDRPPVIDGAALSSLTTADPVPVFPRRSVAVAVFVVPAVLAETLSFAGVGPLATPLPLSAALQMIETLLWSQPAAFGRGERTPVTVGPVLSST